MNDQPAQDTYVNSYQPPVVNQPMPQPAAPVAEPTMPAAEPAFPAMPAPTPVAPMMSSAPTPASEPMMAAPATEPTQSRSVSQTLEDQNIFFLLGVTDGTDEEREAFLDELQQVIWEDFIENDVELLITSDEMVEFNTIMEKGDTPEVQEEMIVYLEKLIPDLEEIMLEKALELKEDMVRERIAGMRTYYEGEPEKQQKIEEALNLINQDRWRAAAELLNSLE